MDEEMFAPLRAQLALLQGRVNEQEEALGRAARENEHSAARQRRADRLAAEATERAEWLERKLDLAKRAAEMASEQIERLRAVEQEAHAATRKAEAEADAERERSKVTQERLLLVARSHREQEEVARDAAAREQQLEAKALDAERRQLEAEKKMAAGEMAVRSAQANEERWQSDLNKVRAELATSEAEQTHAALRSERELTDALERCRSA